MEEGIRRDIAKETLDGLGVDVMMFTDGSVEEGVKNGGAACVYNRGGEEQV